MVRPIAMRSGMDGAGVRRHLGAVQTARHRQMLDFIAMLKDPEILENVGKDDVGFSAIIDVVLNEFRLERKWFAEEIGYSIAAIGRWAKLQSMPAAIACRPIIEAAAKLMEQGSHSTIYGVPLGFVIRPLQPCQL